MLPSSRASSRWWITSFLALVASACVYTFSGGGGLPGHVDSIAILPFENQTTQFTLTQELTQSLQDVVPAKLGLRPSDQASADAVLRGTILRYDERATNYQQDPDGPVIFQREVTIAVRVEIYDATKEEVIWEAGSLSGAGQYLPDSQPEEVGRQLAIDNLVTAIIDGAQSQW